MAVHGEGRKEEVTTMTKPKWTTCDRNNDISELYAEIHDPDNEKGHLVTAYMHKDCDGYMIVYGVSVEDGITTTYHGRASSIALLGVDTFHKIEQHEMEARA
jgi:hypothetical protein